MKKEFPNIGHECQNYKVNEKIAPALERLFSECGMGIFAEERRIDEMIDAVTERMRQYRHINISSTRMNNLTCKNIDELSEMAVDYFHRKEEAEKNITIVDDHIVIKEQDAFSYEIPLKQCLTVWGALGWLSHMAEKTWVTEEKLWRIAELMSLHAQEKGDV
jgi:hypothetical protein